MEKKHEEPMKKVSRIVSYEKLDPAIKKLLAEKYPEGFSNFVTRYPKPNGEFFYAVSLDTEEINYMVKIQVKIDLNFEEDFEKESLSEDSEDTSIEGEGEAKNTSVEDIADTMEDDFNDPM